VFLGQIEALLDKPAVAPDYFNRLLRSPRSLAFAQLIASLQLPARIAPGVVTSIEVCRRARAAFSVSRNVLVDSASGTSYRFAPMCRRRNALNFPA